VLADPPRVAIRFVFFLGGVRLGWNVGQLLRRIVFVILIATRRLRRLRGARGGLRDRQCADAEREDRMTDVDDRSYDAQAWHGSLR
jgi:hypothetical protein